MCSILKLTGVMNWNIYMTGILKHINEKTENCIAEVQCTCMYRLELIHTAQASFCGACQSFRITVCRDYFLKASIWKSSSTCDRTWTHMDAVVIQLCGFLNFKLTINYSIQPPSIEQIGLVLLSSWNTMF